MALAAVAAALTLGAIPAEGARMLRVGPGGKAHVRHDRLLPPARATTLPRIGRAHAAGSAGVTARLSAISPLTATDRSEFDAAMRSARTVRDGMPAGTARDELSGVIANASALDASGQLTS